MYFLSMNPKEFIIEILKRAGHENTAKYLSRNEAEHANPMIDALFLDVVTTNPKLLATCFQYIIYKASNNSKVFAVKILRRMITVDLSKAINLLSRIQVTVYEQENQYLPSVMSIVMGYGLMDSEIYTTSDFEEFHKALLEVQNLIKQNK